MPVTMVDRGGNAVQVPDEEVHAAYLSGKLAFPKGAKVNVTDDTGKVFSVAEADAGATFANGFKAATPVQVQAALAREQYGDTASGLAASGEGLVRGGTLGLSDPAAIEAARAFGGDAAAEATREHLAGVKAAHPTIAAGSELVGAAAPLLLSDGGAAPAVAARGLGVLPRATAALGRVAEGAAARAVGTGAKTALGRVAQAAVRTGAQGAAEGAVYGAGATISEAALGDHELTGEQLVAGMKHGAVLGGLVGGALGGGVHAIVEGGDAVKRGVEALAQRTFGSAAPNLGETFVRMQSALSGGDRDALRTLGVQNLTPEAKEARRLAVFDGEAVKATAARDMRRDVDQLLNATRHVSEEAQGGLKVDHVIKLAKRGNEQEVASSAADYLTDVQARVKSMLADEGSYGQRATLKEAEKTIDSTWKRISDYVAKREPDRNAQIFAELDHLKQRMGKWAKPGQFLSADQASGQVMREQYEGLRQLLQDEALFGDAAVAQREINIAWTKYLDTTSRFDRFFTTEGPKDPLNELWTRTHIVDPAKVDGYLNGLGLQKNDLVHETIREHLANSRELADTIAANYAVPKNKLVDLDRIRSSTRAFEDSINKAEKTVSLANQLGALERVQGGVGQVGATLIGAGTAGPVGAVLGLGGSVLSRPGEAIRQLAAIERMASRVNSKIGAGIKGFIAKARTDAAAAADGSVRGAARFAASRRPGEEERHASRPSTFDGTYAAAVKRISELAANPQLAQANIEKALGPEAIAQAPEVAASFTATSARGVLFLASKIPAGHVSPSSLQPHLDRARVSDFAKAKFLRYERAVHDPTTVVDDLEAGRVNREGVEALKFVYPKMFAGIQAELTSRIAEMKEKLPYPSRLQLGILFDVATDPTLEPGFIKLMQASYLPAGPGANGQSLSPPPRGNLNIAGNWETQTQRIEQG